MSLITSIRDGIRNDEFEMYYQPIIRARDSSIAGVESLVRWHSRQYGTISPADFIHLAERSLQMPELEQYILEKVFRQCKRWRENQSMPGFVSINLSSKGLIEHDITCTAKHLIETYGVDPAEIEFEITETALPGDMQKTLTRITSLKSMGFSLSLDDFGAGYSSLNYLRLLPISRLKVDRSLINSIPSQKSLIILEHVIQIAHRMHLAVVAEGVETSVQDQAVKDLSCDFVQGFLYGRPEPARAWAIDMG